MSGKVPSDAAVNERRLRPIYDSLDNGNNKKALQEAEKVLKKQKDFQCAKVLKCIALLRLGRQEECVNLLKEVHEEAPVEDSTLQAMSICYRELHKTELIADAYEKAIKKDPQNEELMSHLFMAYVRLGEYKKQQLIAMNLYRLRNKNPYYFWSVMSIYMQAISATDEKLTKQMLLPLAEKMTKKFIDEESIEAEAEVELYLMILEKQGKYQEMIDVFNGPLFNILPNHLDLSVRRKGFLLVQLKQWEEAYKTFKGLIDNNLDQLEYYLELFKVAFELDLLESAESNTILNDLIDFICRCVSKSERSPTRKGSSGKLYRGPFLAKIELFYLLKEKMNTKPSVDGLLSRLNSSSNNNFVEYFKYFGHKPCCFQDFCYLFSKYNISGSEISSIIEALKANVNVTNSPATVDELYRHLCLIQLNCASGTFTSLNQEDRLKLVSSLVDYYDENLKFGQNLLPGEFHPADTYVLIASNLLINDEIDDPKVLYLALLLLERAILKSPSNYNCKLLLVKLYGLIGAFAPSFSRYESMEIKYIQQDTMGYLISNSVLLSAHFHIASHLISSSTKFYTTNYRDTFDYLISCYKYGSFTKVEDIMKMRNKLSNSMQYRFVQTEKFFVTLILEAKSHESFDNLLRSANSDQAKDTISWDNICDNRDTGIFQVYSNELNSKISMKKVTTFENEVHFLKIRNLIMKAIMVAYKSVSGADLEQMNSTSHVVANGNSDGCDYAQHLSSLLSKLEEQSKKLETCDVERSMFPLQAPQPSRLLFYKQRCYLKLIQRLLDMILSAHRSSKENNVTVDATNCCDQLRTVVEDLICKLKSVSNVLQFGQFLEEVCSFVDFLSLAIAFVDILSVGLKNVYRNAKKSRKKKVIDNNQDVVSISVNVQQFGTTVASLEEVTSQLTNSISTFDPTAVLSVPLDLSEIGGERSHLLEPQGAEVTLKEIHERIEQSYKQSLKELNEILQFKQKYLMSLKL